MTLRLLEVVLSQDEVDRLCAPGSASTGECPLHKRYTRLT